MPPPPPYLEAADGASAAASRRDSDSDPPPYSVLRALREIGEKWQRWGSKDGGKDDPGMEEKAEQRRDTEEQDPAPVYGPLTQQQQEQQEQQQQQQQKTGEGTRVIVVNANPEVDEREDTACPVHGAQQRQQQEQQPRGEERRIIVSIQAAEEGTRIYPKLQ